MEEIKIIFTEEKKKKKKEKRRTVSVDKRNHVCQTILFQLATTTLKNLILSVQ